MARPKHPVTAAIDDAIALLERAGEQVTPDKVRINVQQRVTWSDWPIWEAAEEALRGRVQRQLKDRGYVIADADTRERKGFWDATVAELEVQLEVKERSSGHDQNRIAADRQVLAFLREKNAELGYDVYPGLFHADIDRIYAMNGLTAPGT